MAVVPVLASLIFIGAGQPDGGQYDPNAAASGSKVDASTDGKNLTVSGSQTTDLGGTTNAGVVNDNDSGGTATERTPAPAPPRDDGIDDCRVINANLDCSAMRDDTVLETAAAPGRTITISDLARFVPTGATLSAEPSNIAVVGLPANFLSTARTESVPGSVLGRALTVRFTAVSHLFDYGDGEKRTSPSPGTPWTAAQPQFTPTDTSHVYKAPGTYTATVTTTYIADIDLGAGWQTISGTLAGPPASQTIRVVTARTALVQNTCGERPGAAGC
ncbi:hypothetical protein [Microbacterium capsulatum]|uniref:PKD domain-containing protein n=1 Tax=Microbacterium capsulatum TaxID=3041921 RepID=A0ABU0XKC6_9MICO|nr:hypothetical protein [Microbacterium sp. ASV81]MDQ4215089.1 hypothetical protein [Microbacterium sp. ASV81]